MKLPFLLFGIIVLFLLLQDACLVEGKPKGKTNTGAVEGMRKTAAKIKMKNKKGNADGPLNLLEQEIEVEISETGKPTKRKTLERTRKVPPLKALKKKQESGMVFEAFKSANMSVIMYTDGDTLGAASAVGMVGLITNDDGRECRLTTVNGKVEEHCPDDHPMDLSNDAIDAGPDIRRRSDREVLLDSFNRKIRDTGSKRQTATPSTTYVELCLATDEAFLNFYRVNLGMSEEDAVVNATLFLAAVINEVNSFYSTIVSNYIAIEFVILDTYIATTASQAPWAHLNGNGIVTIEPAFARLLSNVSGAQSAFNYSACDLVTSFTGQNISSSTLVGGPTLGVAYVGGVCSSTSKLAIVEGQFHIGLVTAHELGHNLCANHDTPGMACAQPIKIMYPSSQKPDAAGMWYNFSQCTINKFTDCIWYQNKVCLTQNSFNWSDYNMQKCQGFTGHILDTPAQDCLRSYGTTSLCATTSTNICSDNLHCNTGWPCNCATGANCGKITTSDGFLCEEGTTKRCYQTRCRENAPTPACQTTTAGPPTTTGPPTTAAPTTTAGPTAAAAPAATTRNPDAVAWCNYWCYTYQSNPTYDNCYNTFYWIWYYYRVQWCICEWCPL